MNKIVIKEDRVTRKELDNTINVAFDVQNDFFGVTKIVINVLRNTELILDFNSTKDVKLNIDINISKSVVLNLFEYRTGKKTKVKYNYSLEENSEANVFKYYDVSNIKEMVVVNLNGEASKIDYNFKTISTNSEHFDINIYHNNKNSISDIKNMGVNINDGNLVFNVSTFIPSGHIGCVANQNSRIVNLTNNKCLINPNLFIDEYDTVANHSAHIGKFSDQEMFYLNTRGIDEKTALTLLIDGVLKHNMGEYLIERIKKSITDYWG